MKFSDYLKANRITAKDFAIRLGVSVGAVLKWRYGTRVPRLPEMLRIEEITSGAVTARDWASADEASK